MKKIFKKLLVLTTIVSILSGFGLIASASDPYIMDETWNQSTLKYYIADDRDPSIPSYKYDDWIDEIDNAINMWNTYLNAYNINLEFVKTINSYDADITFLFDNVPGGAAGEVTFTYGSPNFSIINALVELDDYQFDYYEYENDYVNQIIAHEIGHLVGLKNIKNSDAATEGIYSIMIYDKWSAPTNYRDYPTSFDMNNIDTLY